jgi:hypothetical protein
MYQRRSRTNKINAHAATSKTPNRITIAIGGPAAFGGAAETPGAVGTIGAATGNDAAGM